MDVPVAHELTEVQQWNALLAADEKDIPTSEI